MRGRKPNVDNVVPLTGADDSERAARHDKRAMEIARELRPRGLEDDVRKIWDRMAPRVCHPTVDRLHPQHVETFAIMCRALARYERLRLFLAQEGEVYATETRNGLQYKNRPEVGQMNEAFRQFLTLARDFGLTPSSERAIRNSYGQPNLFDDDEPDGIRFA